MYSNPSAGTDLLFGMSVFFAIKPASGIKVLMTEWMGLTRPLIFKPDLPIENEVLGPSPELRNQSLGWFLGI